MHFGGPSIPYEPDQLAHGCAPHDRVIHHDDAFPFQDARDGIEFYPHVAVPFILIGIDEGPADIVVPYEPNLKTYPRSLGEPQGRRVGGIGDADDDVGVAGGFLREFFSPVFS